MGVYWARWALSQLQLGVTASEQLMRENSRLQQLADNAQALVGHDTFNARLQQLTTQQDLARTLHLDLQRGIAEVNDRLGFERRLLEDVGAAQEITRKMVFESGPVEWQSTRVAQIKWAENQAETMLGNRAHIAAEVSKDMTKKIFKTLEGLAEELRMVSIDPLELQAFHKCMRLMARDEREPMYSGKPRMFWEEDKQKVVPNWDHGYWRGVRLGNWLRRTGAMGDEQSAWFGARQPIHHLSVVHPWRIRELGWGYFTGIFDGFNRLPSPSVEGESFPPGPTKSTPKLQRKR